MPNVRDILRRFRPAAAPGPAATGGVPADRVAEREAELAPVFALLEDVEMECAQLLAAARSAAVERRAQGVAGAQAVLEEGLRRADRARAEAAASRRRLADEEAERILRDAHDQARRTAEKGRERLPAVVAAATDRVRLLLGAADADPPADRAPAPVQAARTP